jgi:hypothetical protein
MLLERATGLAARIERYTKLKDAAKEADLVSSRAKQIGDAEVLLTQARIALARFSEAGINIQFTAVGVQELTEKATTLRAIAAENPADLARPPFNVAHEFINRLNGLSSAANKSIAEGWKMFVAENAPSGSDDVLDALGRLPQMQAGVTRIRQCRQKAAALAASVPVDPSNAVAQLRALSAEHGSAWAELTADSVPESVLQFLKACAADGAPITTLTNEVRVWLESRGLLGSFRVRIG